MSNKSLLDKLQEIEDKILQAIEGSFFKIQVSRQDVVTLQQARYLIDRICKAVSEET